MFWITRDPSSGSSIQSLAKILAETCWSNFKYFVYFVIILIVSTNYIFVHLLDNKVF